MSDWGQLIEKLFKGLRLARLSTINISTFTNWYSITNHTHLACVSS